MLAKKRFIILGVVVVLLLVGVGSYVVISHQPKTEKVVVVKHIIAENSVLMANVPPSDFVVESRLVSQVPSGAYIFTTEHALICDLSLKVTVNIIHAGHILLRNDPDIEPLPHCVGALCIGYTSPYSCPS